MNLFRRTQPSRPDLASALDRLERLGDPSLRDAAALQSAILRTIYRSPPQAGVIDLAEDRARDKLHSGVPLLRGENVPLDITAIQSLMRDLCRVVRQSEARAGAANAIATAIDQGRLDIAALVAAVLDGQVAAIREQAAALKLDGDLLCTLLRFSLFPALEQVATQVAPLRVTPWQAGYCPTCGSWPLLGEYRGLDQARFLRCGLCATEWQVDRLLCPFCGCRDHQALGYLHIEGDQQKRAATCEQCRCYNKTLATLTAIPPIELAVDDLATIHLDMIALERGYQAPT